jgi:DNA-binding MarR family transcriptional regulator
MNVITVDNPAIDAEFIILENIYNSVEQQTSLRQRDLAQIAGAALGMTNSILKRLTQKGWITVKKMNSRNIQYAVTLEGINEIIHRSYRYFKRTIRNVVYYKDILEEVVLLAKRRNLHKIYLLGKSDLDFIVEHACRRWGMGFSGFPDSGKTEKNPPPGAFLIYAESIPAGKFSYDPFSKKHEINSLPNSFYLSRLIMKKAVPAEPGAYEN